MTLSDRCLFKKIIEKTADSNLTSCDFAQVSGSINFLENGMEFLSVQTENDLPDVADNIGRFVYVEDKKSFRYSDAFSWNTDVCSSYANEKLFYTWGENCCGRIGDGTTVAKCSPVVIFGCVKDWCKVTSTNSTSAGIKGDGTLWTWGRNGWGQLGNGTAVDRCSPGTTWGSYTNWCDISMGDVTVGIKTDGTLWTWGSACCGIMGNGTTVSRCSPGTIAGGGTDWCRVSTAFGAAKSVLALKTDGTLWTWGRNNAGQLGIGVTNFYNCSPQTVAGGGTTWCSISSGNIASAAIKTDGSLWTWGCNNCGQLGDGTTVSRCSPGTVWGNYCTWCQVSLGREHSAAIKTDGTLWTWGSNECGILADGTTTTASRSSPGTVAGGGTAWCLVSASQYVNIHARAIKTDGTVWTWGEVGAGLLGDGCNDSFLDKCSPATIWGAGTTWICVSGYAFLRTRGF